MFFFPVYAVACWLLAYRGRRSWRGWAAVVLGVMGLLGASWVHWRLSVVTDGRVYLPILQLLMYPYTALVALGGVFVVLLPRRHAPGHCHACGYRLDGLEDQTCGEQPGGITCPECGKGPKEIPAKSIPAAAISSAAVTIPTNSTPTISTPTISAALPAATVA